MRSTNYPRVSRAVLCSVLLLSQHAVVDANNWTSRRASSSRSSTLAVMQPGGRNRPIRDYKAMKRESEEKLARQAEEKATERARQRGELVEEIEAEEEEEVKGAVEGALDKLDTASSEVLGLEEGTPEALGVVLAKVAVIATVGIYGAKKLVAFANAFVKARKEATGDAAGEVSTATKDDEDDQDEGGDEKAVEVDGGEEAEEEGEEEEEEEENAAPAAVEEDGDEVTDGHGDGDGYVTAEEEEEEEEEKDTLKAAAAGALRGMGKAAKDMAEGSLESMKAGLGEAAGRGDGEGEGEEDAGVEAEEGDLRAQVAKGGKVDVSYV